jgi:hypothetical protein
MTRFLAIFASLLLTSSAWAGLTVQETEPLRYEVAITNDTADRTMWAVCVEAWGGIEWMTEPVVLGAEHLPVNWRVDPLEDMTWHQIVVWSSVVGSDLPPAGAMTFYLMADRPLTMLGYTEQYSEGFNVAGTLAVPEPEFGLAACAVIGAWAFRRRKPAPRFQKRRRWSEEEILWATEAARRVRIAHRQIRMMQGKEGALNAQIVARHQIIVSEIRRLVALTGRKESAVRWMVCRSPKLGVRE